MENNNNTGRDIVDQADAKTAADAVNGCATNEALASLFHRAFKCIMRAHHHQGHAEHAQMRVLAILKRHESMNQRELLEMLNVRSASLSELLGKLEQRNLINRSRDEQDKRNIILSLTEEGSTAAAGADSARKESMDAIFAVLSETEREQLAGLLHKVITSLEEHVAAHHAHHGHGDDEGHDDHHAHERGRHDLHSLGERVHRGRRRGGDAL